MNIGVVSGYMLGVAAGDGLIPFDMNKI